MKIRIDAPCKLNLFLDITGKRSDGYHLLATAFHTVGLADRIQIADAKGTSLAVTGRYATLTGDDPEKNLLMKVYRYFAEEYGFDRPLAITLEKSVPVGAGLGGGSSDAAHFIMALDRIGRLSLSAEQLKGIAVRFGADVPFFIHGGFCWATGIGEVLTPFPGKLTGYAVIVYPRIHIATKEAYGMFTPGDFNRGDSAAFLAIAGTSVDKIANSCYNVFQEVLLRKNASLASVKARMEALVPYTAHMSGSGSAFFFLFETRRKATLVHRALADGMDADVFTARLA